MRRATQGGAEAYDVIVVGSGIAGLSFALKVAARGWRVLILTKKDRAESNTNYAQGGIAAVTSQMDDFNSHVRDTLVAGDGLCDEAVVRTIVEEGPARIQELAELGVKFTRGEDGKVSLGMEGGHSKRRILHVKDVTGRAIEQALLHAVATSARITTREHFFAIDLITAEKVRKETGGKRGRVALQTKKGPPQATPLREKSGPSQATPLREKSGPSQATPLQQRRVTSVQKSGPAQAPALRGQNRVVGLYALDVKRGVVRTFRAPVVMLATGGVGQVYQYTTNPDIATGDGVAMAYRAGVVAANLEFIQFHPTALYTQDNERFLISEAVRGEGAVLRNAAGEAFMKGYDARGDLAPRDVVARAIDAEMKRLGSRHVWLDLRGMGAEKLRERFPNICAACARHGIDVTAAMIPVVPAAHYLCGGVRTNLRAETGLAGLYACGEVACTGLHGANRLASNSLLEAVVLAHRGAGAVNDYLETKPAREAGAPDWVDGDAQDPDERVVLAHNSVELKQTMWDYVGIVRTTKRLERARARIAVLAREIEEYYWNFKVEPALLELRNLALMAELIVKCALRRKESRGLHYILDYPGKLKVARDTVVRKRKFE